MCVCVCVCVKELTHSIIEAGKSQDLEGELASWRPSGAMVQFQSESELGGLMG